MAGRLDRKQALLKREEEIQNEIRYYEARIEEAKKSTNKAPNYESDSSESDFEFTIDDEPSIADLREQQKNLKTCLLATEELTDLTIVQSEMNILTEDPVFEGNVEPPSEPGVWKEVIAECRIDLIPFSINFFTHKADRQFAPIVYYNLQVLLVKKAHDEELSKSVLPHLKTPADVIMLIRSYSKAYRSRRTTLAKLAEKYQDVLSMEPKPDGGCVLKCANILELSWTLQNKVSKLANFHHKMSIDLEYIGESYLKIIQKANKKLSNQSISTEERTTLLSIILDACLESQGVTAEGNSESETDRRNENIDNDANLMAPPKTLPKKAKKSKEAAKRQNSEENPNPKRPRTDEQNSNGNEMNQNSKVTKNNNENQQVNKVNENSKDLNKELVKQKTVENKKKDVQKEIAKRQNSDENPNTKRPRTNEQIKNNEIESNQNTKVNKNNKETKEINKINENSKAKQKNVENKKKEVQKDTVREPKDKKRLQDDKVSKINSKRNNMVKVNKNNVGNQNKNKDKHTDKNNTNNVNTKTDAMKKTTEKANFPKKLIAGNNAKKNTENGDTKTKELLEKAKILQQKDINKPERVTSDKNPQNKLINVQNKRKSIGVINKVKNVNKTKIPLKKFPENVKNPTRISPRKMSFTKPPSLLKTIKTNIPIAKRT